jgi:hypothetical protein
VKRFKNAQASRNARGFHVASNRRQVNVKRGVYSGIDELGFTADEIRVMDPGETRSSSRKSLVLSTSQPASTQGSPVAGSNIRYHHPDWCASAPVSPAHGATKAKTLKVLKLKRTIVPVAPPKNNGYDSDQSLLLY